MSRLGEFTVDGSIFFNNVGTSETSLTFDSTAYTALSNCDFVLVTVLQGVNNVTVRFNTRNAAILGTGVGTTTNGDFVWSVSAGRSLHLPKAIFVETTGVALRAISSTASTFMFFNFCSWV